MRSVTFILKTLALPLNFVITPFLTTTNAARSTVVLTTVHLSTVVITTAVLTAFVVDKKFQLIFF
jgi:hypothetical protein